MAKSWKQYPKAPGNRKEDLKPNTYYKSWRSPYKLAIRVKKGNKDEVIHFGNRDYDDYTIHQDAKRRRNYLARAKGIKNKQGRLTWKDPFSANYHAIKILW